MDKFLIKEEKPEQKPADLEEEEEDGEIYEVEKILNCITDDNGDIFYLVKWAGYDDPKDYTWEPIENLTNCQLLVEQYHEKNKPEKKEQKKARKREAKREKKQQNEKHEISDQSAIKISEGSSLNKLSELQYHQLQKENVILLKDSSSFNNELTRIDSLWFIQNNNYEPKKKIFINRIFSDEGNLLVELRDESHNTSVYDYSLISTLFPQPILEHIESNYM